MCSLFPAQASKDLSAGALLLEKVVPGFVALSLLLTRHGKEEPACLVLHFFHYTVVFGG